MLKAKLLAGGGEEPLWVDSVFSVYTYTGNGSTQTITNGIDLSTNGGLVWCKNRTGTNSHGFFDTTRGSGVLLRSNSTAANAPDSLALTGFASTGFTLGADSSFGTVNETGSFVSWTFRKAPKFFSQATATVTGGVDATVSFSDLATLGMVAVKRTDSTGSWYVWHRSLTAGKLLYLEQTAAEATLGHITVSGTTVTLEGGVIANGTYIVYAWAHDTATDGIVQCGSFSGSGTVTTTLGWEPQYVLVKQAGAATGEGWEILDNTRALAADGTAAMLQANASGAESPGGTSVGMKIKATGFTTLGSSTTYIYLAIRRPNKPPTVGTQVYNAIARTGTGAAATVTGVGFAPDLVVGQQRAVIASLKSMWVDRLRGTSAYLQDAAQAELTPYTDAVTAFGMDGMTVGVDGTITTFNGVTSLVNWCFKRAPGAFEEVCYTGTGANHTESHSLGVAPELWIIKDRSAANDWAVGCTALANTEYVALNATDAKATGATYWNSTYPTASVFSLGTMARVNTSTNKYVAYLFATKAGISKVGSYTGTATTNAIDCGFTTGARFVLIKRTDSTGDWYVWDTVRGIIADDDPYLLLNSTAAETTSTDYIDPSTAGFELSSTAPAAINASGGTFIYLAFA